MKRRLKVVLVIIGVSGVVCAATLVIVDFMARNGAWPVRGAASRMSEVPLMSQFGDLDRAVDVEYIYRTQWRYNEVYVTALLSQGVLDEWLASHQLGGEALTEWKEAYSKPPDEIATVMHEFGHATDTWSADGWLVGLPHVDERTGLTLAYDPQSGRLWGIVRRQHSASAD